MYWFIENIIVDLSFVLKFSKQLVLKLNADEIQMIMFGNKNPRTCALNALDVKIGGVRLTFSSFERNLELWILNSDLENTSTV